MSDLNTVVVRGAVRAAPDVRQLRSGITATSFDLATTIDDDSLDVPVVLYDTTADVVAGDRVVVIGRVRRRFFRSGGATLSRTEVVADEVIAARRRRRIAQSLATVRAKLEA